MISSATPLLLLAALCVDAPRPDDTIRFATFNVWELSREKVEETENGRGSNPQLRNAAAIVQAVRPDVLLVQEIDSNDSGETARLFCDRYLNIGHLGKEAIDYPHLFIHPVNTGVRSGLDLNSDGDADDADDAWGYGQYSGQYGMAILSRFPVNADAARTFQLFRWASMPQHVMPDGREGRPQWYPVDVAAQLRLSSKSHWDVPILVGERQVHLLVSHPTPPVFDGDEDRNGRRNHDEIRFWSDYISGGKRADYITDDQGRVGGLVSEGGFLVMGDLNSDPDRGARFEGAAAVSQLLSHSALQDPAPSSRGGIEAKLSRPAHIAAKATSDFGRLDYVLPSKDLSVTGSGVFWPRADEPFGGVVAVKERSSDHCLVWVDIRLSADRVDSTLRDD